MDTFAALADPTRRNIIEMLSRNEQSFGDIAKRFEMSRPAVSQHLKTLREAGIVKVRADAQKRIYSVDDDALEELDVWLDRIRGAWRQRLDRLEDALHYPEE